MFEERVATLRRLYQFFRDRDYAVIDELAEPDAVIDVSRNVFNPGVHQGVDGLRRFVAQIDEMWTEFDVTPEEFIDAGDTVIVGHRMKGTGRESGVQVELRSYVVIEFHDGKISRFTGGRWDRDEALEFAGVSE